MVGVSPAFYISSYGKDFNAWHVLESIDRVADLGFSAMQLEVFRSNAVNEWSPGVIRSVRERLDSRGIVPTQFVAHFALEDFTSTAGLRSPEFGTEFERLVDIASNYQDCAVITIPMARFRTTREDSVVLIRDAQARMKDILRERAALAAKAGKKLALEIMPGALVNGIQGLRLLRESTDPVNVFLNFDTGHAAACKENLAAVIAGLGAVIVGTHLCDNHGYENLKLVPGDGSIDFVELFRLLKDSGYTGSFDLEILCAPDQTAGEYARAFARVQELMGENQ